MSKFLFLSFISLFSASAFAIANGDYHLVYDRFGMCPDRINLYVNPNIGGSNSIMAGIWFFNHINEGTKIFDGADYRSTTTVTARGNSYLKVRSLFDRASGKTTTQVTRMNFQSNIEGDRIHIVDRDTKIPATTVDCSYLFIRR